jgi:hypothetical protein
MPKPVPVGLKNLAVSLVDFSTLGKTATHYTLDTAFRDAAASLDATGSFDLGARSANANVVSSRRGCRCFSHI